LVGAVFCSAYFYSLPYFNESDFQAYGAGLTSIGVDVKILPLRPPITYKKDLRIMKDINI